MQCLGQNFNLSATTKNYCKKETSLYRLQYVYCFEVFL